MPRRGFTLTEVTIVIGLFAILVSLGTAVSGTYLRDQYLRAAGEAVVAELRRAQTEALTQADDSAHGIKLFPSSVVRFAGTSYAARTPSLDRSTTFASDVTVTNADEIAIPEGAYGPVATTTITVENAGLGIDITLTPYGVLTVAERTIGD